MTDDAYEVFTICAAVERKMGEVYQRFAQLHRNDPTLHRLWLKTAGEEENHALQFDRAKSHASEIAGTIITTDVARGLLKAAETFLADVRSQRPRPREALQSAIQFEQRMAEFHLTHVAIIPRTAVRKLFEAMHKADRDHTTALDLELSRHPKQ